MNKAMILTIGIGAGVENGLIFSIRQQNPNYIYFVYSRESEATLDKILDKIKKDFDSYDKTPIEEVNDVEILYKEYVKCIEDIIRRGYRPAQIVADYTSGTKSMSAALVSAAISKEIGILSYIYGSRDSNGKVISNTERSSQLMPNFIFTEQKINLFKKLFNKNQYENAIMVFSDGNIHNNFKTEVDFLKTLAELYAYWDRFDFQKASEEINKLDLEIAKKFQIKSIIVEHKKNLHTLKTNNNENNLSELDVIDLFSNAIRRFEEGKYDDSVCRLYRLIEMIGQIEFIKEYKTTNDKVNIESLPEDMKNIYRNKGKNNQIELGLMDTFIALKHKNNSISLSFFNELEKFKKLLSSRNHSRLAHGQHPISKETCEKFIEYVKTEFKIKNKISFPHIR